MFMQAGKKYSRRRARATGIFLTYLAEPLEPRTLLSGLTIITHGASFLSTSRPDWIDSMATAIRTRTGSSTAIYTLRIEPDGNGGVEATSFGRIAGPSPTSSTSTNAETVLLLDWAAAAGVNIFQFTSSYSTTAVAQAAIPFLTTANPSIGLAAPLVEGSIQMIGHSRGASLVSELARLLGQRGIWVDQVTTLDPVPVSPDPQVSLKSNVLFADNYYQNEAFTHGKAISGAYNKGPLNLGGAYGILEGEEHGDVHLYYHGTINLASNASDGAETVKQSWYTNNSRGTTGFYFSRLIGGERPRNGIASTFGGTGSRSGISHNGSQWANLAMITLPDSVIPPNQEFTVNYKYNSFGHSANVTWYLDTDTNPYNNTELLLSAGTLNSTGDAPVNRNATFTITATEGSYYIVGKIDGEAGTRYAYSSQFSLNNRAPQGQIDPSGPPLLKGWVIDPDAKSTPLSVRLDVDGVTFATMTANLTRPELAKTYGNTAHGFAFDISSLPVGIHRFDVYAYDSTDGTPTQISSSTFYNNQAPYGKFTRFNGSVMTGWAYDPDAGSSSIQILYTIDGGAPIIASADVTRTDLTQQLGSPNHGFNILLPQLKAGKHQVAVYAIDPGTKALTLIGTRQATVNGPTGNKLPKGTVESASTTLVQGWAFDANTPKASIYVRVDVDGVEGTPVLANVHRPDLKPSLGGSNFGFSQALSLTPGEHRLDVWAIDPGTGTRVLLGSRIVGAVPPAETHGEIEVADNNEITGWAYTASVAPEVSPLIRIDIDNLVGTPFQTDLLRTDINTTYGTTATLGFSIVTPHVSPGTHTVSLKLVDPLTLLVTELASVTFVAT